MKKVLTDVVWVKLSDSGKLHLKKYCEIYEESYKDYEKQSGWFEFWFSDLMMIFGRLFFDTNNPPPFISNEVHFDKPF